MPTDTARPPKPDRVRSAAQPYRVGTVLLVTFAARVPGLTAPLRPREPVKVRAVVPPAAGEVGGVRYAVQRQAATAGRRQIPSGIHMARYEGDTVTLPGYFLLPAGL